MEKFMKWDLNLSKKFNSTNHFRLINQLRSELRAYPLKDKRIKNRNNSNLQQQNNNNTISKPSNSDLSSITYANYNPINNDDISKNQIFNNSKQINNDLDLNNNNSKEIDNVNNDNLLTYEDLKKSFKDRLRDIDMR